MYAGWWPMRVAQCGQVWQCRREGNKTSVSHMGLLGCPYVQVVGRQECLSDGKHARRVSWMWTARTHYRWRHTQCAGLLRVPRTVSPFALIAVRATGAMARVTCLGSGDPVLHCGQKPGVHNRTETLWCWYMVVRCAPTPQNCMNARE